MKVVHHEKRIATLSFFNALRSNILRAFIMFYGLTVFKRLTKLNFFDIINIYHKECVRDSPVDRTATC